MTEYIVCLDCNCVLKERYYDKAHKRTRKHRRNKLINELCNDIRRK